MAEEVDLNGFNSELAKSQQLLTEFCSSAEKFSTSLKPKTFQEMTVGMGMLTKSIQNLVMSASGLENSVGSMSSLTKTLEMLSKLDKLKIGHLIDVSTLKGETDAAKELIQSVMNKIVDGITKSPSTAFVSMFEPIKKQYQDVVNLYKNAPKDVKEPVFNFTDAEKRLAAIKERLKELNEYYALLKKQNTATPGGRLPMEISKTSKEIKTLEATETALVEKINQANAAQEKYNSNVLKSLDFINAAAKAYSSIQERLNTIKITGGFEKEQAQLEQWKAKILEILAPYQEIAQCQSLIEQYSKEITNQESKQSKLAQEIANHDKYVANMQKVIEESKERQNKKQAKLNELVQSGNLRAASIYLKQEASYSRFNAVIDAMKRKQEQCNMATEKGRQEYQKYADQIEVVRAKMSQLGIGTSRLGEAMGRAKNFAEQMAMSFGIMTGAFGLANFLRQLYKITAEFQLQTKALAAIINNTREANILFKQMQTLAVESPMKLMDLNKYAKQLAAFRIETRELYSSLKMLGDISVGVGVDMGRLILAYGQVKSANYLRGQELRQFSEAGVNILGGLRDYYKDVKGIALSLNDIFDMISKRKVLFEDVDAVMKRMTESGGAFYNMQLIQSQTLYGQVQKLGDLFQIEMNNVGKSTSGMLLGFVRVVQTVIKNLRIIGTVLVSAFAVKSIMNAAAATTRLATAAKAAGLSVSRLQVALQRIGILRPLRRLTSELTIANAKAILLKTNLGKLAIGAAIGAGIAIISKAISDAKERAENLRNELEELANRKYDIKGIEEQFGKKSDFKERLALLQELNEKAKEYGYRLQLPTNINAKNINKAFKDATEELRKYTEQVQYYSAMLDSGRIERAMGKKLDTLSADFAIASQNAEALFKTLSNNITSLDYADKSLIQELTRMRDEYLNDEEAAVKKYGMTTDKWKHEFIKRMSELNLYKYGYSGDEIIQYDFLDKDLTEKQIKNINEFAKNSVIAVNSAIRKFRRQLKRKGDDLLTWGVLDPAELEKKFRESYPAIVESLKKYGDYSKAEIATIVESLSGLEKGTIAKLIWKFENGTSDLEDSSFTRLMNDIFGNDFATIEQDFKIKIKVDTNDITPQQQEYLNQFLAATGSGTNVFGMNKSEKKEISEDVKNLARANDEVGKIIRKSGQTAQGAHEELESLWKSNESAIERYSEAIGTTEKAKKRLAGINQELSKGYTSAEQALKDLKAEQKEIDDIYDVMVWKHDKTKKTKGRAQSFVDEYQSMIDLIKKLNQEYDKLRQNFSEDDSYQKIIDNFNESFGEMPDEFKAKFKELKDIVFQSKLGTAEGEKIVKDIIEASSKLKPDEKKKLERNLQQFIDQLEAEADVEIKIRNDEKLKYRVQKMFDEYNLTLEIDKLGFDTQEIADLFNITTRDLYSLQTQLESMKDKFMGKGMEKEYRQHMRKIVEMNEKANLEMAKKYVKYLRQEYDERAKLEIEYMKKRADVYSLPFESDVQSRIIDNLKKEFEEKMSKLNWDAFRGSDAYIELFEDLGTVSTKALTDMRDKIYELKGSLTGLKPSDMKTMVDAIRKLDDEVIKRNPFKAIIESMREIKKMKMDETLAGKIKTYLGDNAGLSFRKNIENALNEARNILQQKKQSIGDIQVGIDAKNTIKNAQDWLNKNLPELQDKLKVPISPYVENIDELENEMRKLGKDIDTERLKGLTSDAGLSEAEQKWLALYNIVKRLSDIKASKETEEKLGFGEESVEQLKQTLKELGIEIKITEDDVKDFADAWEQVNNKKKGIKQFAEDSAKSLGELKGALSSLMENLDYFGGTTDDLTEAWKEFGESIFDTIIGALNMIPSLISGFTAAGVAINSAMGIVGLIAEIIQLVITLLTSLYKLHDAKIWHDLDKYTLQINRLKKAYEDLSAVFDDMYSTDDLVSYTSMTIENLKKTKWEYEQYQTAYSKLKKQNAEDLENVKTEIENLEKEIRERSEKLKEELGGFGSMANMKSMAQEWSDAWYDAFKETGDGLSGLEESFDEFLDNLYKRQILNALGKKYFEGLFKDLDNLLLKEGGLKENRYEFSEWADRVRDAFGAYNEEAKEWVDALSSAGGLGSNLEGLQASIQGMTETTAQALEGYLNAIRLYVAEDNERLAAIANSLLSTTTTNPMLEQLRMIAANTSAMQTLLDSVVQPSGYQGANGSGRPYIRVHAHMD